jgi:hypothetical protein
MKIFKAVIIEVSYSAIYSVLPLSNFYPSLILTGKAEATKVESLTWYHSISKLLALPANIKLGWK